MSLIHSPHLAIMKQEKNWKQISCAQKSTDFGVWDLIVHQYYHVSATPRYYAKNRQMIDRQRYELKNTKKNISNFYPLSQEWKFTKLSRYSINQLISTLIKCQTTLSIIESSKIYIQSISNGPCCFITVTCQLHVLLCYFSLGFNKLLSPIQH